MLNINSSILALLFFLVVLVFVPAGLSYFLAVDKGRKVAQWTVLGMVPFLNLVFLLYFLSATNLRLEAKLDKIITSLDQQT